MRPLSHSHAARLIVEQHGQLVVNICFRVAAKAFTGILRKLERGFPLASLIAARPGAAQIAAGNDGAAVNQPPSFPRTARAYRFPNQLRTERHDATHFGERLIVRRKRPIFHAGDFEHRQTANQILHAAWIVHARHLHDNFAFGVAAALLLHGGFGQS